MHRSLTLGNRHLYVYMNNEGVRRISIWEVLNTYEYKKERDTIKYMYGYFYLSTFAFFVFIHVTNFSDRCS